MYEIIVNIIISLRVPRYILFFFSEKKTRIRNNENNPRTYLENFHELLNKPHPVNLFKTKSTRIL